MSRKRPHSETVLHVQAPDPDSIQPSTDFASRNLQPAPYDDEEAAIVERDGCDYSVKITQEMAHNGTSPRRIRVYADGIYDLFHAGHARQLMQAKNVFPKADVYLIVGCCSDALTRERKGKTVMTEDERYASIRHCRYVDEVVKDAPWTLDDDFLVKHKIDFVAHDDAPYTTGSGVDVYADIKAKGMFVATQRTEGVSTSDIVARIVRDYDMYIRRNLARGYSAKDLNVSFLRGQRLRFANKVDEVKGALERKKEEVVTKVEETSKEVIGAFLSLFGQREWSIDAFWQRSKNRLALALSPSASPVHSEDEDEEEPPPPRKRRRAAKKNGVVV